MSTLEKFAAALQRRGTALIAAAILLTGSLTATAQVLSLYYQEAEKDGVVYVFNTFDQYKAWKESGEMGKAPISLPDAGPSGQLVIAENEAAVDLYNFKHSKPAYERAAPKAPETKPLTWKDGKTTIEGKNAKLVISNRIQVRHTYTAPDHISNIVTPAGQAASRQSKGTFRIRRAKTAFEGWIYNKDLTYKLQLNWADTSSSLEDAWINYDVFHNKAFQVKAGQFKAPTGRQELTSSGRQQFTDRSIVSAAFAPGYQAGLQVGGEFGPASMFSYGVGLFNGNGRNQALNDNNRYLYASRLQYQPLGDVGYSEADFETVGMKPLIAVAVQYTRNNLTGVTNTALTYTNPTPTTPKFFSATNNDLDLSTLGADLTVKWHGLSVFTEYYKRRNTYEQGPVRIAIHPTSVPAVPVAQQFIYSKDFDSRGLAVQAGYFLWKRNLEVTARYAAIDPNMSVFDNELSERGIGLNWYFNKHNHKIQMDARDLSDDLAKDTGATDRPVLTDREYRLQYQFIF